MEKEGKVYSRKMEQSQGGAERQSIDGEVCQEEELNQPSAVQQRGREERH